MAQATKRPSSARKSTSARKPAAASSRSGGSRAGSARSRSDAASNGAGKQSTPVVKNLVVPVATAAAGIVGGVLLERRRRRPRKILGVPIPGTGNGLDGVAKEISKAGKQLANLAAEVQTTRKKAEDVGKAIS